MGSAAAMATATLGFALTFTAWSLIHPLGYEPWQSGIGVHTGALLVCVQVVVGSLGRIPVGILTDRYGARVVFPAVILVTGAVVLATATAVSRPVVIAATCALGVAGTAFAAGAPVAAGACPLGWRGFGLSVYGVGIGGAAIGSLTSLWVVDQNRRHGLYILGAALIGCAILAAVVLRGSRPHGSPGEPGFRVAMRTLGLPATRNLATWYAVAFGGVMAMCLYVPTYLSAVFGLQWTAAVSITAAAAAFAAVAVPVGGWLCGRQNPLRLLSADYVVVAALTLGLGFQPTFPFALGTLAVLALCLGLAVGVVLALIGRTAPVGRLGLITGAVGAAGGLAGLVPPVLLVVAYARTGSYAIGWTLVAGMALASATYLRGQPAWTGAALAFPAAEPVRGPATTVVSLSACDAARNTQGIVTTLSGLATVGDLVIVYGESKGSAAEVTPHALATGLRGHVPRRAVTAVYVGDQLHPVERGMIAEMLDDGALLVVYTTALDPHAVAAELAGKLGAGHLLTLTGDHISGTRLMTLPWPTAAAPVGGT
jgi:NNP family nitrate/nitrite transporter-like MFS transporter